VEESIETTQVKENVPKEQDMEDEMEDTPINS